MNILQQLRDRLAEIDARLESLRSTADTEARQFSDEETTEVNSLCDERDALTTQIAARERLEPIAAPAAADPAAPANTSRGRRTAPETRITPVESPLQRERGGFLQFGDFLQAVMGASARGGRIDSRLIANAPTTFGTEGSGPDGGFSIPPDYRSEIVSLISSEATLWGRTDQQTSSSNTFVYNRDETAPWSTAGIQAYWVGEGKALTETKPVLRQQSITLHKLAAMVTVTEELAQDSASLDRWIRSKAPAKIAYELDRTLIHGTGAGQPLGILNSPALVTVAKEGSQTADTVNVPNLVKMWSRCYGDARNNAVWLIQQDVEPQLLQLSFGSSINFPVYLPPGGLSASPYGTLFGRPVITSQLCETVGDLGDIFLCDWRNYITVSRAMRQDLSIHLYFDYDCMAFRFIMRAGGQPGWSTALSPRDGSNTLSPFVTLAERA